MICKNTKKRVLGIDIVRFVAFLFIPCVHFFLHNGFYYYPIKGKIMFIMLNMRWLFFNCVPLFILLTGYLNGNKKLNKEHYKNIIPIIISYIFISIITIFFKILYLGEQKTIVQWIIEILNYRASNYAWYIEMYIGLFLLIPFLNILYDNINNKLNKLILVITMIFITSLPSILNLKPGLKLIPDYWINMYPLTYYFLGKYIKEYPIRIKKIISIIAIIIICFIESIIIYSMCYDSIFDWSYMGDYNGILTVITTLLIFSLFYDIDIKNKIIRFFIQDIAKLSLDMYLISYIFDIIIYKIVLDKVGNTINTLPYFFLIIPIVVISSYIVAFIKRIIFESIKYKKFKII